MKLELQNDKVAIRPIFPPDQVGHIIIPDQAKDRCKQGIVQYIGPDCKWLKVGDYVLFGAYDGTLIAIEDELFIFVREEYCQCVVENIPAFDIPGLYLRDKEGYFGATFNMVMDMLQRGIKESKWFQNDIKITRQEKPKYD